MDELSATDHAIIGTLPAHLRPQARQAILRDRRELALRQALVEHATRAR